MTSSMTGSAFATSQKKFKEQPSIQGTKCATKSEVENESSVEIQEHEEKAEKNDEVSSSIEEASKQGIKIVLYFLKDKIPGLQISIMNINAEEEGAEDSNKTTSSKNTEEEVNNMDVHNEGIIEADNDASADEKDLGMNHSVVGVVSGENDTPVKDLFAFHLKYKIQKEIILSCMFLAEM